MNCERVILLMMSTLPERKTINTYRYEEHDEYTFKGISQLEAGTKYFLQKSAKDNKCIDRIVVIASDEASAESKRYGISAVELYRNRIIGFISGDTDHEHLSYDCIDEKCPDVQESRFLGTGLYNITNFSEYGFKVVKGSSPLDIMWKASNEIKGNAERIELMIDMQGGDRNDIPMVSTVLELLEDQNVSVIEHVATGFEKDKTIQPIKSVDEKYRSYNLATAYHVFMWFGRGDYLARFFKQTRDEKIADSILEISQAVLLCDVSGFDSGLFNLANAIENRGNTDENNATGMDFIIDKIKEDFGELLNISADQTPMKYVNQIRWCLDKGYIQQAMTILESKMPKEFVWNAIDYYCDTSDDKDQIMSQFENIYDWYISNPENKRNAYRMIDLDHYWIKYFFIDEKKAGFPIGNLKHKSELSKKNRNCLKTDYLNLCKKRNVVNHAADRSHKEEGFFAIMQKNKPEDEIFKSGDEGSIEDLITDINDFLGKFESMAATVDEDTKKKVVDLA